MTQGEEIMSDNTTPPDSPMKAGFDLNGPTIISLLYLSSLIFGVTAIVGLVLAYVWRGEAEEWEESHYSYLIRTFWLGLAGFLISLVLTVLVIGFFTMIAIGVVVIIRSIMSLIRAQKHEPIPRPETLFF
jgi:uncharacterized membrane protein